MAITTRDGLIAAQAAGQRVRIHKTTSRTSVATIPFSVFDIAGAPGAGVLAGTSTAAGVVPDDATAGTVPINAFTGSKGYLSRVDASSPVACRLGLYDMIFKAGAYVFNADVSLASQPSFSSRVPGGTDYKGTEVWLEAVTAFTGNQTYQINYLDQDGNAGDTGAVATAIAPILGRMLKVSLASGDSGVQRIDRVRSSVSSVGTFNVLVLRKLWEGRIRVANDQIICGPDLTGLPEVFANSALIMIVSADSTATSTPEIIADVING